MFVMETDNVLWLARGTPRAWLEDGRRIAVRRAPSRFGEVGYEIVSHVRERFITVTVDLPERSAAKQVLLRLRHPQAAGLRGVEVQGRRWDRFDAKREVVRLDGLSGRVVLRARY